MQMQKAKYTAEFKEEAVRQVIDRSHSVVDLAKYVRVKGMALQDNSVIVR